MIIDRTAAAQDWERVLETYPVPPNLRDHQLDAMSLLKQGNHVFLGKINAFTYIIQFNTF